jgi:hypothetical protein
MDVSLHWSRLNRRPSAAETKDITGLMDHVEERILDCKGVPQRATYATHQNW